MKHTTGMKNDSITLYESKNIAVCNICQHDIFTEGSRGRLSKTGKKPRCRNCGSLERHRAIRQIWTKFVLDSFVNSNVLQFSLDPAVDKNWFGSFEVSIYGKRNTLDLQDIDRESGIYDIVICNHILEHIKDDRQAFREIFRILKSEGFLQFSVLDPKIHQITKDSGYPNPSLHNHYRVYGRDLIERFTHVQPNVQILEIDVIDPVTEVSDFCYFASTDRQRIWRLQKS